MADDYITGTFIVEKVVGHKPANEGYHGWKDGKIKKYLIKWMNYADSDNTWEIAIDKEDEIPEMIISYWKEKYPRKFANNKNLKEDNPGLFSDESSDDNDVNDREFDDSGKSASGSKSSTSGLSKEQKKELKDQKKLTRKMEKFEQRAKEDLQKEDAVKEAQRILEKQERKRKRKFEKDKEAQQQPLLDPKSDENEENGDEREIDKENKCTGTPLPRTKPKVAPLTFTPMNASGSHLVEKKRRKSQSHDDDDDNADNNSDNNNADDNEDENNNDPKPKKVYSIKKLLKHKVDEILLKLVDGTQLLCKPSKVHVEGHYILDKEATKVGFVMKDQETTSKFLIDIDGGCNLSKAMQIAFTDCLTKYCLKLKYKFGAGRKA